MSSPRITDVAGDQLPEAEQATLAETIAGVQAGEGSGGGVRGPQREPNSSRLQPIPRGESKNPRAGTLMDKKFWGNALGEALIRLRRNRPQRQVAISAGVPTGTWCQWEKGQRVPRDHQFANITKGLDCSLEELQVEMWKAQGELFLQRGADLVGFGFSSLLGAVSLLERVGKLQELDTESLPEPVRASLHRLIANFGTICARIDPVLSEVEALVFLLRQGSSIPPKIRINPPKRQPGRLEGKIRIAENFDDPLPEFYDKH